MDLGLPHGLKGPFLFSCQWGISGLGPLCSLPNGVPRGGGLMNLPTWLHAFLPVSEL